jgi:hypothetical protein
MKFVGKTQNYSLWPKWNQLFREVNDLIVPESVPVRTLSFFQTLVMSTAKLSQKLSTIATSWPIDPFRPTLQLRLFLQSLSTHPNLTPNAIEAANALKENLIMKEVYFLSEQDYLPCGTDEPVIA